jgi:cephalosporin-C deacetylase-like acetyl esterase
MIVRSGRAFLYPIYKGTYERRISDGAGPMSERELMIAFSRDLGRALDYLATRPDLDAARVAYFGVSSGGDVGVILTALEPRLKASVLQGTGLWHEPTPELDLVNYAPRVRVPTLMLSGRYDFARPLETTQRPLFALLGPPAEHKHHAVLEAGHVLPSEAVAREILPWLDRYLGPVKRSVAR